MRSPRESSVEYGPEDGLTLEAVPVKMGWAM